MAQEKAGHISFGLDLSLLPDEEVLTSWRRWSVRPELVYVLLPGGWNAPVNMSHDPALSDAALRCVKGLMAANAYAGKAGKLCTDPPGSSEDNDTDLVFLRSAAERGHVCSSADGSAWWFTAQGAAGLVPFQCLHSPEVLAASAGRPGVPKFKWICLEAMIFWKLKAGICRGSRGGRRGSSTVRCVVVMSLTESIFLTADYCILTLVRFALCPTADVFWKLPSKRSF